MLKFYLNFYRCKVNNKRFTYPNFLELYPFLNRTMGYFCKILFSNFFNLSSYK